MANFWSLLNNFVFCLKERVGQTINFRHSSLLEFAGRTLDAAQGKQGSLRETAEEVFAKKRQWLEFHFSVKF